MFDADKCMTRNNCFAWTVSHLMAAAVLSICAGCNGQVSGDVLTQVPGLAQQLQDNRQQPPTPGGDADNNPGRGDPSDDKAPPSDANDDSATNGNGNPDAPGDDASTAEPGDDASTSINDDPGDELPSDGSGNGSSDSQPTTAPAAPSQLRVALAGPYGVDVLWNDNAADEDGYSLEMSLDGDGYAEVLRADADSQAASLNNLSADTHYYLRLRARRGALVSAPSNVLEFSTLADDMAPIAPPAAATNPRVSQLTARSLTLSWDDNSSDEDGYRVFASVNGVNYIQAADVSANVKEVTLRNLFANTHYWLKVQAFRESLASEFSAVAEANTLPDLPPPPTAPNNLRLISAGAAQLQVAWNDQSSDETGFALFISDNGSEFSQAAATVANVGAATLAGLLPGTRYSVKVRAMRNGDNSEFSNVLQADTQNAAPPPPAPAAPSNLRTLGIGQSSIDLAWNDNAGDEDGYRVFVSDDGSVYNQAAQVGANATLHQLVSLNASSHYYVRVRAFRGDAVSAFSNTVEVNTQSPPPPLPAAPSNVRLISAGLNSLSIAWDDNSADEEGFFVYVGTAPQNMASVEQADANATSILVGALSANTEYFVAVRSFRDGEESAESNVLSARTQAAPPPPPVLSMADARLGAPENQANVNSGNARISRNGECVVFESYHSNLVAGDTNGLADVFLFNRRSNAMTRVSVASDGAQANGFSINARCSADGRFVVFQSGATNLVAGDTNACVDVFHRDMVTGVTTRLSVSNAGEQGVNDSYGANISADGRYVAFASLSSNLVSGDNNNRNDVFVRDMQTGVLSCVSLNGMGATANHDSLNPSLSDDGRYIAFETRAFDIQSDSNNTWDIYVRDQATGDCVRVSNSAAGSQGNNYSINASISADGRYVAFISAASNLVSGDTNNATDCFVADRQTGAISRVSVTSAGGQSNGLTQTCSLSGNAGKVLFRSFASNLVTGDSNIKPDVFMHDLVTHATTRVSVSDGGAQGDETSSEGSMNGDGTAYVFLSGASNFHASANEIGVLRVFVRASPLQ